MQLTNGRIGGETRQHRGIGELNGRDFWLRSFDTSLLDCIQYSTLKKPSSHKIIRIFCKASVPSVQASWVGLKNGFNSAYHPSHSPTSRVQYNSSDRNILFARLSSKKTGYEYINSNRYVGPTVIYSCINQLRRLSGSMRALKEIRVNF